MRDLIIVASYTMKDMLKRNSFIISMAIIVVLIIIGFNIPNLLNAIKGESDWNDKILIVDSENVFEGALETLNQMDLGYDFEVTNENIEMNQIKERLEQENGIDACIVIKKQSEEQIKLEYIVKSLGAYSEVPTQLVNSFNNIYKNIQVSKMGLTEEQIKVINTPIEVEMTQTDENAASGNVVAIMLLSIVLFYAIYFCAYQVSSSITTEKTSRIMETLVTSTSPRTIVLGKTIGIGLVGLIQVLIILIVSVVCAKFCLSEELLSSVLDLSNITPKLAIITIVYFILGYALYALLYALTGSTVSKPEDINSANSPIAIIAVVGFYLSYFSMMNPGSSLNLYSSIIPISSPFSMPFRVMMGTATNSQLIISLIVLVLSILIIAKISIKIYSAAILNYGSKINLKDMFKIYKDKNN